MCVASGPSQWAGQLRLRQLEREPLVPVYLRGSPPSLTEELERTWGGASGGEERGRLQATLSAIWNR